MRPGHPIQQALGSSASIAVPVSIMRAGQGASKQSRTSVHGSCHTCQCHPTITRSPCPTPVAPHPALDERVARELWTKTKVWVNSCCINVLAEIYLRQWEVTQRALEEWYNGQDDWHDQHDKSLAMTVLLRRKIMWLHTRKMVQLVCLLD